MEPDQLTWISNRRTVFDAAISRVWTEVARTLAALPEEFDTRKAADLVEAANSAAWELSRLESHLLRPVLTPIQQQLLPSTARMLIRAEGPVASRILYY